MFDKTITVTWQDEETIVPVTMSLVERVDSELDIMELAVELSSKPKITRVAKLIYIVLNHGGSKTTYEDVYQYLFGKGDDGMLKVLILANEILVALSPIIEDEDDPVPEKKTQKKRK